MKEEKPELKWKGVGLVDSPDRLDERIAQLVAVAKIHRSMTPRGTPPWAVAAACAACLVLGFWANRLTSGLPHQQMKEPAVIIEISAEDLPPSFFILKSGRKASFFERQLHDVEIEMPKENEGTSL